MVYIWYMYIIYIWHIYEIYIYITYMYGGILLSHEKEENPAICDNMDAP